jgi:cytochrome b561
MLQARFSLVSRILHWLLAVLVLAMLVIGAVMVSFGGRYDWLYAVHRPLGIAILVLAAIRLINRLIDTPPPLPATMRRSLRGAARASHVLLYALLIVQPLVGWGLLSAAGYPVVLYGAVELPPLLPKGDALFALLRPAHLVLAIILSVVILLHIGAALMHRFAFRDGVFESMAFGRRQSIGHFSTGQTQRFEVMI